MNGDSFPKSRTISILLEQPVLWLTVLLFLLVLPLRPEMASLANLELLLLSAILLLVPAIGQTFVLITGGIDLSLPAVMSLCSVIGASIMYDGSPLAGSALAIPTALIAMIVVGLAIGALHGVAVAVLRMPAFLVSLASLILIGGIAVWYTRSERLSLPDGFIEIWYGRWLGIPIPVFLVGALSLLAHILLTHTVAGRRLYAIGHSVPAARISGVPIVRTTVLAYMASGFCAAVASVLFTARLYTGSPQLVENEILLDCIGAAVIGGTSLFGGRGRITGTVLGVLFMALVGNSLNMLGLRYWHVILIKGVVILLAALLDSVRNRVLAGGLMHGD